MHIFVLAVVVTTKPCANVNYTLKNRVYIKTISPGAATISGSVISLVVGIAACCVTRRHKWRGTIGPIQEIGLTVAPLDNNRQNGCSLCCSTKILFVRCVIEPSSVTAYKTIYRNGLLQLRP
jgi:hypothetical protein